MRFINELNVDRLPELSTGEVPVLRLENSHDYVLYLADQDKLQEKISNSPPRKPDEPDSRYIWRMMIDSNLGRTFIRTGLSNYHNDNQSFINGLKLYFPNNILIGTLNDDDLFACYKMLNEGVSFLRTEIGNLIEQGYLKIGNARYLPSDELVSVWEQKNIPVEVSQFPRESSVDIQENKMFELLVRKGILFGDVSKRQRSTYPQTYFMTSMR